MIKPNNVFFSSVRLGQLPDVNLGPDFWMYTNVDVIKSTTLYPVVSDASSSGSGTYFVNFGQEPFQGHTLGYEAYDNEYDSANWVGSYTLSSGDIRPNNLKYATYMKSYNTGKKYYEITVYGDPHVDHIGLVTNSGSSYLFDSSFSENPRILVNVGSGRRPSKKSGNGSVDWYNYFNTGQTIQVWIDFDNGNILIKRLGTTVSDYITPVFL